MNIQRFVNFRWIFYPFLACLFGVIVAGRLFASSIETLIIAIILLSVLAGFLIWKKKYKIMLALFLSFFIGCGLYFIGYFTTKPNDYQGQVAVTGRVSDSFEENDYDYVVILDSVTIDGKAEKNIKAYISKGGQKVSVGDTITFESEIESIDVFTLGSFNSDYYRNGVGYTADIASKDLVILESGKVYIDEQIRMAIKEKLYENMTQDSASISYAVLFGDQSGISFEIKGAYRDSGIIHLLAVSGLNISFLIAIIFGGLKLLKCNKYVNFLLTSFIIIFYCVLCGMTPSVLRAGFMGIIMIIAMLFGRRYDSLNAMGVAGFTILLISPLSAFDVGFLMSIACVCGIILLYPFFYKFFAKFCPNLIAQYLSMSFSAQVTILPFLALFSSQFNLLFFMINLIVVPLFSILYPFLVFMSVIVFILPFLSPLFKLIDYGMQFVLIIAGIFANSSLVVNLSPMSFGVMCFFFLLVFVLGQFFMAKKISKWVLSCVLIMALSINYGFSSLASNMKAGVCVLTSYGDQAVILQNTSGERLLVGQTYILSRYMNNHNVKDFDGYVAFESLTSGRIEYLSQYNITSYIAREGDESYDSVFVTTENEPIKLGDFIISYLVVGDDILGVQVYFDEIMVFVANDDESGYNIDYYNFVFDAFPPSLVVAGENDMLCNGNYISYSRYKNDYSTFDFASDGNLYFKLDGQYFIIRGLD